MIMAGTAAVLTYHFSSHEESNTFRSEVSIDLSFYLTMTFSLPVAQNHTLIFHSLRIMPMRLSNLQGQMPGSSMRR